MKTIKTRKNMKRSNHSSGFESLSEALESALVLDNGIGAALRYLSGEEGHTVVRNSLNLCHERLQQALFDLEKVRGKRVSIKDCSARTSDLRERLEAIVEDEGLMGSLTQAEANLLREAFVCVEDAEAAIGGLVEEGFVSE